MMGSRSRGMDRRSDSRIVRKQALANFRAAPVFNVKICATLKNPRSENPGRRGFRCAIVRSTRKELADAESRMGSLDADRDQQFPLINRCRSGDMLRSIS